MSATRLTRRQREALTLIQGSAEGNFEPHGVATTSETHISSGEAWVHWRTAEALERRGLIRFEHFPGEGTEIYLTEAGHAR